MEVKTATQENFCKEKIFSKEETSTELKNGQKVEATQNNSKNVNFFTAPERVPFPAPVNGDVNVEEFLAASYDYVELFCHFGFLYQFVVRDVREDLMVIREFYEKNKEERKTLGSLLASSVKKKDTKISHVLLWFRRGVEFYHAFLIELHDNARLPLHEQKETVEVALTAHGRTLKNHQGFVASNATKLVMKTLPTRATVLKQLCYDDAGDGQVLYKDAMVHVRHLPQVIQVIDDMYKRLQIDTSSKA